MLVVVDFILIVCLSLIAIQDFKHRAISWYILPIMFLAFLFKSFSLLSYHQVLKFALINLSFIIIQLIILTAYMSIKNKKVTNIINTYLGIGDVLFFITLTVAFSPVSFIAFYILSLMITLLFYIFYKIIFKNASTQIPLAGGQSICFLIAMLCSLFTTEINFYNDDYLVGFLI